MNTKIFKSQFFFIAALVLLAAVLRFIPHWPNFTPLAAMALFGGTYIKRKELAFLLPIAAMFVSDLFIGFHATMIWVYVAFIAIVALGFVLRRNVKVVNVVAMSLASSTLFFLVTNFGTWMTQMMPYPMNVAGLMQAYIAGLPFFLNGIMGDLFFCTVLFGSYYVISKRVLALNQVR